MKIRFKSLIIVLIICASQTSIAQHERISLDSLDVDVRNRVFNFAFNFYNAKSLDQLPIVNENVATSYFMNNYKNIGIRQHFPVDYGEIKSIKLIEVLQNKNGVKYYRYKVKHENSDKNVEIQIGLNKENKFLGMQTRDLWVDKFNPGGQIKLKEITIANLDKDKLSKNKNFAYNSYSSCIESKIYKDKSHSWNELNGNKLMAKECDSIKTKLGGFDGLVLKQVLTDSTTAIVYRYKTRFEKLEESSEIRLYSNLSNEYYGLFVVDLWYDKYIPFKEAIKKSEEDLKR